MDLPKFYASDLRTANYARQQQWDPNHRIDLVWRVNELFGEAGEFANVLKKLRRESLGIQGSRATMQAAMEEIADVVICADLVGMHLDLVVDGSIHPHRINPRPDYGLDIFGLELAQSIGRMAIGVTPPVHVVMVQESLRDIRHTALGFAERMGFDLWNAVVVKFNATSRNNCLSVFLSANLSAAKI